jgi:hypothetical protein
MIADTAIRRLAFAEARTSSAEAMMAMVERGRQLEQATTLDGASEEQETARFTDSARQLRESNATPQTNTQFAVDKTA